MPKIGELARRKVAGKGMMMKIPPPPRFPEGARGLGTAYTSQGLLDIPGCREFVRNSIFREPGRGAPMPGLHVFGEQVRPAEVLKVFPIMEGPPNFVRWPLHDGWR